MIEIGDSLCASQHQQYYYQHHTPAVLVVGGVHEREEVNEDEDRVWCGATYLPAELRARFDELGRVGHEPGILSSVSVSSHPTSLKHGGRRDGDADADAHASTAPAVAPAKREWRGFSFLEDMIR